MVDYVKAETSINAAWEEYNKVYNMLETNPVDPGRLSLDEFLAVIGRLFVVIDRLQRVQDKRRKQYKKYKNKRNGTTNDIRYR